MRSCLSTRWLPADGVSRRVAARLAWRVGRYLCEGGEGHAGAAHPLAARKHTLGTLLDGPPLVREVHHTGRGRDVLQPLSGDVADIDDRHDGFVSVDEYLYQRHGDIVCGGAALDGLHMVGQFDGIADGHIPGAFEDEAVTQRRRRLQHIIGTQCAVAHAVKWVCLLFIGLPPGHVDVNGAELPADGHPLGGEAGDAGEVIAAHHPEPLSHAMDAGVVHGVVDIGLVDVACEHRQPCDGEGDTLASHAAEGVQNDAARGIHRDGRRDGVGDGPRGDGLTHVCRILDAFPETAPQPLAGGRGAWALSDYDGHQAHQQGSVQAEDLLRHGRHDGGGREEEKRAEKRRRRADESRGRWGTTTLLSAGGRWARLKRKWYTKG
mmetsp:Transcript_37157/g.93255  ORF Transcript_37157/g.93255 Transcript_37157/m.93255 type:complete len:378 (-) Transcript_37157:15-1148(-)